MSRYDRMPTSRKFRMLRLKKILEYYTDETHSLSMTEILERMNEDAAMDRRALYEDVRDLSYLGTEVVIDKGKTPPRLNVVKREFEYDELRMMADAIASSKFLTKSKSKELIDKLRSFCTVYEENNFLANTMISNRAKRIDEDFHNNIGIISQAINTDKKISFRYFRILPDKGKQYNSFNSVVSPWLIMYANENYYLIASVERHENHTQKLLDYRIDRMDQIELLEERREGEKEFKTEYSASQIKTRTQTYFNMFGQDIQYVHLKFRKDFYYVMYDTFGSDVNTGLRKIDGGEYYEASVKVSVGKQFLGWLFSMNGKVEAVDPKIREMMLSNIEELRNTYK